MAPSSWCKLGLFLAVTAVSSHAAAETEVESTASATSGSELAPVEDAPRGRVLLSLERALSWGGDDRREARVPIPSDGTREDEWSTGIRGVTTFDAEPASLALRAPRIAADLVVDRRWTVGAAAIVWTSSRDDEISYISRHERAWTTGVAPRVGVVQSLGSSTWFWLKLGVPLTYTTSAYDAAWFNKGTSGTEGFHATIHYLGVGASVSPTLVAVASRAISFAFGLELEADLGSRWTSATYTDVPTATPFHVLGALATVGLVVTP